MSTLATHLNTIRNFIFKYPVVKKYAEIVEAKTKINTEYFVVALGVVIIALLFIGTGAGFLANIIGFTYPVYATIHAIESETKTDDTEWLTYWVVFSSFSIIENFVEFIKYWIPFYYPLKVTFLLWCMLPNYRGANVVYLNVIKPLFLKHSNSIDEALNSFSGKASKTAAAAAKAATEGSKTD